MIVLKKDEIALVLLHILTIVGGDPINNATTHAAITAPGMRYMR
jgi:hypothetical protein